MKRFIEYGVFTAAIFTAIYLGVAFVTGVVITIIPLLLCVAGGGIAGILVACLLIYNSPGDIIPEGDEDKYITKL